MFTRWTLLKCVGKAVVKHAGNAIGLGFLGDVLVDVGEDVWKEWNKDADVDQRRQEMEEIAQAAGKECRAQVEAVVREVAGQLPEQAREAVAGYLQQVPAMLRRSLRRPADPTGASVPSGLVPRSAQDIVPLLPGRLPRFKPGDRPLPGVDWELVELLGAGGFGEVWKVRNHHFAGLPPAALKFCLDPAARDRLLRHEADMLSRVMAQVVHPGIVRLQQTYLGADPPCLQYEYVEGGDLAGLIRQWHEQSPGPTAEQVTRQLGRLAEVIGFAHRLQPPVVHRDLKPANILLESVVRGPSSVVKDKPGPGPLPLTTDVCLKVADFGIGGVAAPSVKQATALRGSYTPLYASPQQMRGGPPDPRDDVHALGVLWFQMLTGDLTTGAPTGMQWPRRLLDRGLSQPLVDLLASCIEARAEDRPADAAVLTEAITRLLPTPPPVAVVVSTPRARSLHELCGHAGPVHAVALSADGRLALTGGDDHTARLWDASTGRELRRLGGHAGAVYAVALAVDGQRVLTGGEDGTMRLWDAGTGSEIACMRHGTPVRGVAFAPDGQGVLSCGGRLESDSAPSSGGVVLWDLAGASRRLAEDDAPILGAVFVAGGRQLLTGGWGHRIRLWSLASGQMLRELPRQDGPVWSVAVSSDGKRGVSGSTDGSIQVWELPSGRPRRACEGHADWVLSVALTADGRRVLSGSDDGTVRLWDADTGAERCRGEGHAAGVTCVALAGDGRLALSGSKDGTARLWELASE